MKSKHYQNFVDVDWPPVLALGRFNWHIGKRRKWPFCIFVCLNFRKCYFSSKISHRSRDHLNSQGYCVIVCWLKPAEVGEDLHRRTMCGGNWRLVVILVVILTSCVDARTKILLHFFLKHKFEIICKSKSRIELWEEDTNQNWKFHPSIIERVRLSAVWTS